MYCKGKTKCPTYAFCVVLHAFCTVRGLPQTLLCKILLCLCMEAVWPINPLVTVQNRADLTENQVKASMQSLAELPLQDPGKQATHPSFGANPGWSRGRETGGPEVSRVLVAGGSCGGRSSGALGVFWRPVDGDGPGVRGIA